MTLHASDNVITHQAKQTAKRKTRKFYAVGAAGAVLLTAGGAYAAMTIFGSGSVTAEAYQSQGLTVTQESLSKKLYPGAVANLSFRVANPNPFPVKVTAVGLESGPTDIAPAGCISKVSSPLTSATSYNIPAAEQVEVPANDNRVVTLTNAVTLDMSATTGCGFKFGIKVTGTQSGN